VFLDASNESFAVRLVSSFVSQNLNVKTVDDSEYKLHNYGRAPLFVNGNRVEADFVSVLTSVVNLDKSVPESLVTVSDEVTGWFVYVKNDLHPAILGGEKKTLLPVLHKLNKKIEPVVFVVSNRLSLADIVLFSYLRPVVSTWKDEETWTFDNISRWYDNIQHLKHVQPTIEKLGFLKIFNRNPPSHQATKDHESQEKPVTEKNKSKKERLSSKKQSQQKHK